MFFADLFRRSQRASDQGLNRSHQALVKRHLAALGPGGKSRPLFSRRVLLEIDSLPPFELLEQQAAEADQEAQVAPWWPAPFWLGRRDALQVVAQRLRQRLVKKKSKA